jgi:hypothetical protein
MQVGRFVQLIFFAVWCSLCRQFVVVVGCESLLVILLVKASGIIYGVVVSIFTQFSVN